LTRKKIVIVDNEPDTIEVLKDRLIWWNYEVKEFCSGKEALEQLRRREEYVPDLFFLDLMMPEIDGLKVLEEIKKIDAAIPVIIMTAHGTMETTVRALKKGAYDYILKPFVMNEVEKLLKNLFSKEITKKINGETITPIKIGFEGIIGSDSKMVEIYKTIGRIAHTDIALLIRGESGTGKELIARSVHRHSLRKNMPFCPLNCAAIPDTLFESELFGYEKGAFTGADERKIGIFERAHKGTIFLDEIGDISISTQAKILRVLQEKDFQRLGGRETIKVDVRVIVSLMVNFVKTFIIDWME
jgi:two-component system response regulator AtoC